MPVESSNKNRRRRLALVLAAGCIVALAVRAEQTPPAGAQATFRDRVDLVQVDVAVLDRDRRPLRGLTAADFTVLEDGKPRPVVAFSAVDVPAREAVAVPPAALLAPPDVVTNQIGDEGRVVVIVMDRSIPQGQPTLDARRIAVAAVNELGPGDLGAVVSTNQGVPQNLTSDRARLLRAIARNDLASAPSAEAQALEDGLAVAAGFIPLSPLLDGRCYCGVCVPETIQHVAEAVSQVARRRKVLLFIGASLTLQTTETDCVFRMKDAREKMLRALDRSGLTIHSIDPSGLQTQMAPAAARTGIRGGMPQLVRQGELEVLPSRTGGRTVVNTNAPQEAVPAIIHESDAYYLIGFLPTSQAMDGRFHRIEVKVNRRGVRVQTRRGYERVPADESGGGATAPPSDAGEIPAASRAAGTRVLSGLLPVATRALSLTLAPFAGPDPARAGLAVVVGLERPAGPADSDARREPLEIVARAFDPYGRPVGTARQTLDVLWPDAATSVDRRIDLLSRLDLKPGDYEVRVSVTGRDPALASSVFGYVAVPRFASDPFTLSGLVIDVDPSIPAAPRDFLSSLVPVVPTSLRQFSRTDRVGAVVAVYQGTTRHDPIVPVRMRSRLLRGSDVVAEDASVLTPAEFSAARAAAYRINLPLAGLAPGAYTLVVDASIETATGTRVMLFLVR